MNLTTILLSLFILTGISLNKAVDINEKLKKYELQKDFEPKNIKIVNFPPELICQSPSIEPNKIIFNDIKNLVLEFATVLEQNFSQEELTNFYNNIKKVEIIHHLRYLGGYDCPNDQIFYRRINSLYHELFHLASSYYDGKTVFTGFAQINKENGNKVGIGLNEGYTELLSHRYFGTNHELPEVNISYTIATQVSANLETIIGQNQMQTLYLKANLMGLIESLNQYGATNEEVMQFINNLDFIRKHCLDKSRLEDSQVRSCLQNTYEFLIKTYAIKLRQQYERGNITIQELEDKLIEYRVQLCIKDKDNTYTFFQSETYNKLIHSILDSLYSVKLKKE